MNHGTTNDFTLPETERLEMTQEIKFDFDKMAQLAVDAPAEFARLRDLLLQDAIQSFSTPENGAQLQAVIDIYRSSNPQGISCYAAIGLQLETMAAMLSRAVRQATAGDVNA